MNWTEERINTAVKLWKNGRSAGDIAERLGDVSRNAVVGKLHRMGLKRSEGPSIPRPKREKTYGRKHQAKNLKHSAAVRAVTQKVTVAPVKGGPVPESEANTSIPMPVLPKGETRSILTVGTRECRFPLWGADDTVTKDSPLCGAPTQSGRPYCNHHHQLCWRPHVSRRKIVPFASR